jgi:zinc transporter ZupT
MSPHRTDKYACPYCSASLQGQLVRTTPAPGERRFLPSQGMICCPVCAGRLYPNPHPLERHMLNVLWIVLPLLWAGFAIFGTTYAMLVVSAAILLGLAAGYGYLWLKYLRHWPQYSSTPRI